MQIVAKAFGESRIPAHVEVSAEDVPDGTSTVTMTRTAQRREHLVRGFVRVPTTADLWARDFEAPFNLPSIYTATAHAADGTVLGQATSEPVRLQSTEAGVIVVHDPLRPKHTMRLMLERKATTNGARELAVEMVDVHGRSAPLASGALRRGWSGIAFDAVTFTRAQAEAFDAMLGGYDDDQSSGVLCIRPSGDVPVLVPRVFYASIARPTPEPYYPQQGREETIWRLEAVEVQPPSPALVEPIVTWADWQAWFDQNYGWLGFERAFPTWAAANRSLIPLGWADRAAPPHASWADWEAWLRDHDGWDGFNERFSSWDEAMRAEEPIGWAAR